MKCANSLCARPAGTLQCPICLNSGKNGPESFFCGQDCFKSSWPIHKLFHSTLKYYFSFICFSSFFTLDSSGSVYNPYPTYNYSGKLRPFPISETRLVPIEIARPDYAETGIPKSEYDMKKNSNMVKPLLSETIEKMRVACKVIM